MIRRNISLMLVLSLLTAPLAWAQSSGASNDPREVISGDVGHMLDDKMLIDGYATKLAESPKDILLAMINDDSLNVYKKAAAARVFRTKYASDVVQKQRAILERMMLRQLMRSDSVFVQIELMHVLLLMDRYRYFDAMIPAMIQKLDHYDLDASDMSYRALDEILNVKSARTREARIVFNMIRKTFFLMRKKLQNADPEEPRLKNKLQILRWSVKVLGTEELKNLPKEVINLM